MEQLRTAADNADAAFLKALPWMFLLVVAVAGCSFLFSELQKRYWLRSKAAYRIHTCREEIGKLFGLTIRHVSRDGRVAIAPGETEKWQRPGLEAELAQFLKTPLKISFGEGVVVAREVLLQSWAESRDDPVSHFLMAAACRRSQAVSKTRLTITASGLG
ncbi:hypothetical protein, partial [Corynebacterium macginleyi]|uniref:hypothetical protein n=1 Tax=Corynebacterium macginleyi TaxID=38290 RepID=UPI001F385E1E